MIKRCRKYRTIAERVIRDHEELHFIKEYGCRVAYLESDEGKTKGKKDVLGECIKVQKTYEWICQYDFVIVIYAPNTFMLEDDQLSILLWHELQHIGLNEDGEEPSFYVVPHDIEDFSNILELYGLHWAERRYDAGQEA